MPEPRTPWPHAPTHQLSARGTYFVTASTYLKAHHFHGAGRLRVLHRGLLTVARDYGWQFEAWAVFFKSLPLRRPFAARCAGCFQPFRHVERAPRQDRRVD